MRRREFLGILGGTAAWPLAARAQTRVRMARAQQSLPVIGFLNSASLGPIALVLEPPLQICRRADEVIE